MSRNSIKAMILAAGLGTRLRPLTHTTPKALLLVGGRPLITYTLRLLKKHGITEVLINLHHLGEVIERELGDGRKFGMRISYSWEPEVLGTGGGVKKGAAFFGERPFFVLNSDILIDLDLKDLLRFHRGKKGLATLVIRPREEGSPHTPVETARGGRIANIGGGGGKFLFTGVQVLEPEFLKHLQDRPPSCIVREGYIPAIAAGGKIFGYPCKGYWNDLGTLDRYREAEEDLARGKFRPFPG